MRTSVTSVMLLLLHKNVVPFSGIEGDVTVLATPDARVVFQRFPLQETTRRLRCFQSRQARRAVCSCARVWPALYMSRY